MRPTNPFSVFAEYNHTLRARLTISDVVSLISFPATIMGAWASIVCEVRSNEELPKATLLPFDTHEQLQRRFLPTHLWN